MYWSLKLQLKTGVKNRILQVELPVTHIRNPARLGLTYLELHPVAFLSAPLVSVYINTDI